MQDRSFIVKRFFRERGFEESIIVTSSFRSGSTFFCSLLRKNGLEGLENERLACRKEFDFSASEGFLSSLEAVVEGLEPPLFATKLMWPHRNHLALFQQYRL